jgi:cellulose synthase/poly-beta-1,6-N-acetylglucosamine synthase-like glycosyltransferase
MKRLIEFFNLSCFMMERKESSCLSAASDSTSMVDALNDDQSEMLPFVSVILPVYNDAEALHRCLYSLQKQTEVIVVDNGSTEDNPQSVVSEFPGYQYSVEAKIGSYAARNKGISLANSEVYAFIDSDCVASPQ